jgi:SAM-dependent methyltransferase
VYKLVKDSAAYWESRYASGRNSGAGSYGRLAEFKAEFLNAYVAKKRFRSVLEFGCGDGAQLAHAKYPSYTGVDISETILNKIKAAFAHRNDMQFINFFLMPDELTSELTLSLDVIYHLVEDSVFCEYMHRLFHSAEKAVVIYSSDRDEIIAPHVRHRKFTSWVSANQPCFALVDHIPNRYPFDESDQINTSFSEFFVYEKLGQE